MRPEDQVNLCCERRGRIHTIDCLVVNIPDEKQVLLSGKDAQALNYLKVYAVRPVHAQVRRVPEAKLDKVNEGLERL